MHAVKQRPKLPRPLGLPLRLIPKRAHGLILSSILNKVFRNELVDGELDFLEGRVVDIKVSDLGLDYNLTLKNGTISEAGSGKTDLRITGSVYDYLLLISGREDPDTLFFQRHLIMDGDTGLGVHLKNVLSAIEMDQLPLPADIRPYIERFIRVYENLPYLTART
ncbi:MAG: sterol-binding protein [gamma proteobacterium symbiont of Ctena orbiculata]|nr:MAG: sterol-binding protein [gamma proteobacterium symbiont of Ctena orbiculata]PVV18881.1 MAG: sterol-binding protein [gamma proteobacterium symbiont of Ctena orbiculata]PVV26004.1 MAG: sterol-binding protein [gamma proteobacterium symbiont of Ctena orbiculata]